jgi:hypothetical protein
MIFFSIRNRTHCVGRGGVFHSAFLLCSTLFWSCSFSENAFGALTDGRRVIKFKLNQNSENSGQMNYKYGGKAFFIYIGTSDRF